MGNCCESQPKEEVIVRQEQKREQYKLPKIVVIPEDAALIYLDGNPTDASIQLKKSLKRKFPNLMSSDSDKRIINQIEVMKQRKCYIVVEDNIREQVLRSLLSNSKVRAIYFLRNETNVGHHAQSPKFKGFFTDQITLKHAIYNDVRMDEIY